MKKLIVGFVVGVTLAAAATAGAMSSAWNVGGVTCKSAKIGGEPSVLCVMKTGRGYGVGLNRNFVIVVNGDTGKTVFVRDQ